jgi:glycosyltransferase involved in cell wall biosynthesis
MPESTPLISLIVTTLGQRPAELTRLLDSLAVQQARNFEVFIVDQSEGGLAELLAPYPGVIHLRSARRGLSYNRNVGLAHARGELVAFPDDDCVLPLDYIAVINRSVPLLQRGRCFAFGSVLQLEDRQPFHPLYQVNRLRRATRWNCLLISSVSLVLNRQCLIQIGGFDENFGVGAQYGASEEVDLILRLLAAGMDSIYLPDLILLHPARPKTLSAQVRHQSYSYSIGALARKHWHLNRNWEFLVIFAYSLFRSLGGAGWAQLRRDPLAELYWKNFRAKWRGFCESEPSPPHARIPPAVERQM